MMSKPGRGSEFKRKIMPVGDAKAYLKTMKPPAVE